MPQTRNTLRALFAHNDWARVTLLALADPLTDDQLDRSFEIGLGSLRYTLEHLWVAERIWLDRWLGRAGPATLEPTPGLAVDTLRARFQAAACERDQLLEEVDESRLSSSIDLTDTEGKPRTFRLGDMMLHVCNHGFHHRAQALNMLRHLDVDAPQIDYIFLKRDPDAESHPSAALEMGTIREFFQYGNWAQDQVLAAAAKLTDAQLDRPVEMGMGTLRKTLLHIRDAEQWWLENWSGHPAEKFTQLPETTSVSQLQSVAEEIRSRRDQLLSSLGDGDLMRTVRARPKPDTELTFVLGDTMLQMGGHGTHHRAQILNMLRHIGAGLPELDFVYCYRPSG